MWEEYRNTVQSSRDKVRKVKAKTELSPGEDVKDSGKDFCKYMENKRKGRKDLGLLLNEAGDTEHEKGLGTECLLLSSHEHTLMNPSSERPGEKSGTKKMYLCWKQLKST